MIENQDNPKQPFIARVDRFFEDTKKETDQKRVLVDWYLRLEDTSQIRNRDFNSYHIFKDSLYFLKIFKKKNFSQKNLEKENRAYKPKKTKYFSTLVMPFLEILTPRRSFGSVLSTISNIATK